MGWATKWLRSLLGAGKKKDKGKASYGGSQPKERKRWSFGKPRQSSSSPGESRGDHSPASSALDLAWLRTFCDDAEEGSKQALAVAVATAAAADAAVTAAHVAVARLKSTACGGGSSSSCEWRAAVRIQTAFRCHLAKKALRALRGLVKLQALVRGFLVRKQAAVMLRRLQALARAQSAARTRLLPHQVHRRSFERYKVRDVDSKHLAAEQSVDFEMHPKIAEMVNLRHKSKSFRGTSSSYEDYYLQHCCRNPDKSPCSKTTPNTPRLWLEAPAKSPSSCPRYMAKTTSFVAKARTQSAPKQRSEKTIPRKKVVASEEAEPRFAVMNTGGGGLRRWPLRVEGMVGKLERATGVVRETAMDYYCSGGGDW